MAPRAAGPSPAGTPLHPPAANTSWILPLPMTNIVHLCALKYMTEERLPFARSHGKMEILQVYQDQGGRQGIKTKSTSLPRHQKDVPTTTEKAPNHYRQQNLKSPGNTSV